MTRLAFALTCALAVAYLATHPATVYNALNPAQIED